MIRSDDGPTENFSGVEGFSKAKEMTGRNGPCIWLRGGEFVMVQRQQAMTGDAMTVMSCGMLFRRRIFRFEVTIGTLA